MSGDTAAPPDVEKSFRVLSIQSHTVHGYVGNKCAVFPLQLLGFHVDPINSVHLSNHTGYSNGFKGQIMDGEQLETIIHGLKSNELFHYSHLLTGYIGSVSFLRKVLNIIADLRKTDPNVTWFCDPVMGDKGKLYIPKELVEVYKTEVVHQATFLSPNQYECELLTGMTIETVENALDACAVLHSKGVHTVIITSCSLVDDDSHLTVIASQEISAHQSQQSHQEKKQRKCKSKVCCNMYKVSVPHIEGHYTGAGDLIASLLLARCSTNEDLLEALTQVCITMHSVIKRTSLSIQNGSNPNKELRLIESRNCILNPPSSIASEIIPKTLFKSRKFTFDDGADNV